MDASTVFTSPRPALLRAWHGLNGVVILGLLGTVLLRKTVFNYRTNGPLIEAKVAAVGGAVSTDGAVAVAKLLRDQMWEWHLALGVALAVLFVVRVVVAVLDPELVPFRAFARAVSSFRGLPSAARSTALHPMLVKLLHGAFYALLVAMVASGLVLLFKDNLGLAKEAVSPVKEAHELMMWGVAAFVPLHVVGVVVAELRGERGRGWQMIHGRT